MAKTAVRRSRAPSRSGAPRRKASPARAQLLSPAQHREVTGVAAIGVGLILGAVLALPGGGVVARPVHDALFTAFGVGAWAAAAGLALTGTRLCVSSRWDGGAVAAIGSLTLVVAVLGLAGLMAPGTAGVAGRWLGPGIAQGLGRAGATALLLMVACIGAVLALDLRAGAILRGTGSLLARSFASARSAFAAPDADWETDDVEDLPGRVVPAGERQGRVRPPLAAPPAPPRPVPTLFPNPEPPSAAGEPAAPEQPFLREFEAVVQTPGAEGPAPPPVPAASDEPEVVWTIPSSELLDTITGKRERLAAEVRSTGDTIVSTLLSFGIESRIIGANSGPTVTQYELQPAVGVPVRKILGYQTDLTLALAAPIRIQPFIPGKSAIGVEVPNKAAQLVSLKEIVQSSHFLDPRQRLSVALGADVSGRPVVGELTRMPHLLIAGATGSGKSVCINALLAGFLLQATPVELKLILIDPKRVELSGFMDTPHLLVPVVVEPEAAVASLRWAVKEMEERYKLFATHGARNIAVFNERAPQLGIAELPYVVIVIDELADLMMVAAGEIEDLICRIAQLARAVGIHLIVATQRPSADIITGLIKANIPSRIAFAVTSGVDSRVILDEMGAEKLLGRGDMLYLPSDEGKPRRLQGAYVSDHELDALINFWKAQGRPDYQEEIFTVEATVSLARDAGKRDPLFAKAAHTVAAEGRGAASLLQRKLNVGYTRAARLIDQLAEHRVVGPFDGSRSREVLMDVLQVDELLASLDEE
jgi:DNA segregation ATPase FtsK/SpoIIIE, S-DNA-T family